MARLRYVIKRVAVAGLIGCLLLLTVVGWNYWHLESKQIQVPPPPLLELDKAAVLGRLQGAIQIDTTSQSMAKLTSDSELHRFRSYLQQQFKDLHQPPFVIRTGRELGDDLNPSLLWEWPGQNPDLQPILLMSHFDVVPVARGAQVSWTQLPFSGHIDEQFVWGRGTLDCKHGAMAILEAMQLLYRQGMEPQRTIYVALGHDEELGGGEGNAKMARWLRSHGVHLHMILDEGGCIFTEFPSLDRPAALVGVAEKGVLNVQLTVDVPPEQIGHASMPPPQTAVGILAAAVQRVQQNPFPAQAEVALRDTLNFVGPEMPSLLNRLAISNLWLFEPLVVKQFSQKPSSNAMLRTTLAPTMIEGGIAENVLPPHAAVTLNLRLLPGDDLDTVTARLERVIDDARVKVQPLPLYKPASAISSTDTPAFRSVQRTIAEIYPEVVVAPFILVGSTDTNHYADLCDNIFRFIPARLSERDTQRFHGTDERLAIRDYLDIIRFFHRLVSNVAGS